MSNPVFRVLVTGSQGFIGRNLAVRLSEAPVYELVRFDRGDDMSHLSTLVAEADAVIHLAGENRPEDESAFADVNTGLTVALCDAVGHVNETTGRHMPVILASSTQADRENPYGRSKLAAEDALRALCEKTGNPGIVFRLPGVFGKWCRPNYNSVVATFCHNIAHGLPIQVDSPTARLRLVYVDDVVSALLAALHDPTSGARFARVEPEYEIGLGELAAQIEAFETGRELLRTEHVGAGLTRALYATYLSNLPETRYTYIVPQHSDARGVFVEMLKTPDCGQVSFLSVHPGVTRGGHYHHSKTEKFLVIKGEALFRFRHILVHKKLEFRTSGDTPQVVETIPGWSHDISNVGSEEMLVIIWANEVFDRDRPDTITSKV